MKRKLKLTRKSLDELAKTMPIVSKEEQKRFIGGGRGTQSNPYSFDEYARMSQSGSWNGGFVLNENFHFQRDDSGNWIESSDSSVLFIPKERPIWLDPVAVEGNRRHPSGSLIGSGSLMPSWEDGYNTEDGSGYLHAELDQYADSDSSPGYLHVGGEGASQNNSLPSVIGKYKFVKFNGQHSACLKLSQQTLGIPENIRYSQRITMVTATPNYTINKGINIEKGEQLIYNELKAGRGVIAGVYYSPNTQLNDDKMTDHFIVIVAMEKRVIDGTERTVYRYYDTRTSTESHGTSRENYLYRKDGKLVGTYLYGRSGPIHYTVTQIRAYQH